MYFIVRYIPFIEDGGTRICVCGVLERRVSKEEDSYAIYEGKEEAIRAQLIQLIIRKVGLVYTSN